MAGVLGKYEWLASTAIDLGFPIIGAALGIPSLAPAAAGMLKKALGMSDSASLDAVKNTIQNDPEATKAAFEVANTEAAGKWDYLARAVEARAKVDQVNIAEVNATIRGEAAAGVRWWHWRHLLGYLVLLYGLEQVAAIGFTMFGRGVPPDQLATMFNSTTVFTLGIFGLLGFVANDTSNLKTAAITGQQPEGIVKSVVKAVTGKK